MKETKERDSGVLLVGLELAEKLYDDKEDDERDDDAKTDFEFQITELHLSSEIDTLLEELIGLSTHGVSLFLQSLQIGVGV